MGEARLAAALQPIAASLTDSSCLRVTVDGEQIVDVHGDTPLIPASTLKLLTASVALDVLGADHKYTTTVQAAAAPVGGVVNGDVWLVGGGDPLLATHDYLGMFRHPPDPVTPLESLADSIVAAGVTQITGRIVGDESRYDAERYVPSWPKRYISRAGDRSDERALGQRRVHEQQLVPRGSEPRGVRRADAWRICSSHAA